MFFQTKSSLNLRLGCDDGCSYCCNLRVTVFEQEAVAVYQYALTTFSGNEFADLTERLRRNTQRISQMTEEEHFSTNIPCAFLRDGRCTVYPVRPSACSAYHSADSSACKESYDNPEDLSHGKPEVGGIKMWYQGIEHVLTLANQAAGRSPTRTELNTAVFSLIDNKSNVRRWKKGKRLLPV